MKKLTILSREKCQVLDITQPVVAGARVAAGLAQLLVTHTTAALTTADLDPGTDLDLLDALAAMVPKLKYRHPHDPGHVPDHILSALIGTALTVPIEAGRLVLGTWQRIVLVEFDGPRERTVCVTVQANA
ncbi:MAG: YjbQ family protein [Candidatus Kerfeldbacteria bacterium]|nr:YjbQ family protein [Candidatus Kerfeldbacteria bacterium]